MALNALGKLEVVFVFKDQSRAGTDSAQKNVKNLSSTVQTEGAKMNNAFMGAFPAIMAVGLMRQMARGVQMILAPSIELQASLREMTAFASLSESEIAKFNSTGLKMVEMLALASGKSAPELITALTELQKKGLSNADAMAALRSTTMQATIAHQDVAESAETAAILFNVFGARGALLEKRMNQLTFAAKNSAIGFNELPEILSRVSSGVAIANPLFEDLIFLLMQTRNVSQSAAVAGTQVRRVFEVFAKKRKEVAAILGIPVTTTEGGLRDLTDMMVQTIVRGDDLEGTTTKLIGVFGSRALVPLAAITLAFAKFAKQEQNATLTTEELGKAFLAQKDDIRNAGETITQVFEAFVKDNPVVMIDRLGEAFRQLATAGGGALLQTTLQLIDSLTVLVIRAADVANWISKASGSISETIPIVGTLTGFLAKLAVALAVTTGAMAFGKAMSLLFVNALQFTLGAVVASTSATTANTAAKAANATTTATLAGVTNTMALAATVEATAVTRATVATTAFGRSALFARAGFASLLTGVSAFKAFLGPVGLAVGAVALIMTIMGGFETNLDQLNTAVLTKGLSQGAEGIRSAANDLAGKVFQSAKRFEDMFKEPPPVLKTSTFANLDNAVERMLSKLDTSQAEDIGPALRKAAIEAQDQFASIKASAQAGEEINTQSVLDLTSNLNTLTQRFQEAGLATGSKFFQELAKELQGATKGLLNFSVASEDRARGLDAASQKPQFASAKVVDKARANLDLANDKVRAQADKTRLEKAINASATVRARNRRSIFEQATGAQGDVAGQRQAILQENEGELGKKLDAMNKLLAMQLTTLKSGIKVNATITDGLDTAVETSSANAAERSLSPGAGR